MYAGIIIVVGAVVLLSVMAAMGRRHNGRSFIAEVGVSLAQFGIAAILIVGAIWFFIR